MPTSSVISVISVNGEPIEIIANTTLRELLAQLGYHNEKLAVAINETFAAKTEYDSIQLQPHDRVDIVKPVQGG